MKNHNTAQQLLNSAVEELRKHSKLLELRGITITDPQLRIQNDSDELYSAELVIYFKRDDQIVDAFEFAIMRNGQSCVSGAQIRDWIDSQIQTVDAK